MSETIGKYKIKKMLIKAGNGKKPAFENGAKATFHFKAMFINDNKVLIKVNMFCFA